MAPRYADSMNSAPTAIALALDPEMLEEWAGSEVFDRGERLVDAVTITAEGDTQVDGSVQGTSRYQVSFRLRGGEVEAHCSCPHSARGFFCKHLVAFGLVILAHGQVSGELSFDDAAFEGAPGRIPADPETPTTTSSALDPVDDFLAGVDREGLLELIRAARVTFPEFEMALQHLAVPEFSEELEEKDVETYIKDLITDACRVGSFVDYYRAGEVAGQLEEVLEEINSLALAGHQKVLVKQSRRFVDRISKILERADDSDGSIGVVLDHAVALHAFICVSGEADPNKVVDWILKVQLQGPGWPDVDIQDFWPILTDRAKAKYRRGLEAARETARQDNAHHYSWNMASFHLVQFADAAEDVDLAVQVLTEEGNFKQAFYRLVHADRGEEADVLFEAMLKQWTGMPGHRLAAAEIVDKLLVDGRAEEAETFIRRELQEHQSLCNYQLMVSVGEHTGQDLRPQARGLVTNVFVLQEVLVQEGETEALWDLIQTRNSLGVQETVIKYFEDNDAAKALELLIDLGTTTAAGPADKKNYQAAADYFARAKKLEPTSPELAQALAEVRAVHYRRTNMLKVFNQRGL